MENIAMALSGGGFRAAAFSLGCLKYLSRVRYKGKPLLENVRYISSTSGGSITNLLYSALIYKGKEPGEIFDLISKHIDGEKLISRAFEILDNHDEWKKRKDKSRNLINAFSIAYDEIFEGATFDVFRKLENSPHVQEISVNATEFTNGISFRFQSQNPTMNAQGRIGNAYIYFDDTKEAMNVAHQLKLGDILASSSCFPSGFEPMIFPNDYSYHSATVDELTRSLHFEDNEFTIPQSRQDMMIDEAFDMKKQFGVMDGGIADNQGIGALRLANDRRLKKGAKPFDLVLICDVSSHYMDGYTLPLEKSRWYARISPRVVLWIMRLLALGFLVCLPMGMIKGWDTLWITGTVVGGINLIALLYFSLKIFRGRRKANRTGSTWGIIFFKYFRYLLRIRLSALWQMVKSRLKSVSILSGDIYLKVIRSMYYDALYEDDTYNKIIVRNTIYRLSKVSEAKRMEEIEELRPGKTIIDTAEQARTMATTLWFDKNDQAEKIKDILIATGEFTTCFSLLKHLTKLDPKSLTPDLEALKKDLLKDWKDFNAVTSFTGQGQVSKNQKNAVKVNVGE